MRGVAVAMPQARDQSGAGLQARRVLEKIRGTKDVDEEFQDILEKAELAALVKNPWTLLLFRKKYR